MYWCQMGYCYLLSNGSGFGRNIFGEDINLSVHVDNRKRNVLILGKYTMQGKGDTTLTAEKEYAISFSDQQNKFCLSLHDNWVNS